MQKTDSFNCITGVTAASTPLRQPVIIYALWEKYAKRKEKYILKHINYAFLENTRP